MTAPAAITLIGMPGSGKSTVGRILAAQLGWTFIDGDSLIQQREGKTLGALRSDLGLDGFVEMEAQHMMSLELEAIVLAPGGSVIYREDTMTHLRSQGAIAHIDVPATELETRLGDLAARGVIIRPGCTIADLHAERAPLLARYADVVVPGWGCSPEETVRQLREGLGL
ncbi:MAG: shikimate kinase [Planctomycetota bacterium]